MSELGGHVTFWDGVLAAAAAVGGVLAKILHGRAVDPADGYAKKEDVVRIEKDLQEHETRDERAFADLRAQQVRDHEAVMRAIDGLGRRFDARIDNMMQGK